VHISFIHKNASRDTLFWIKHIAKRHIGENETNL